MSTPVQYVSGNIYIPHIDRWHTHPYSDTHARGSVQKYTDVIYRNVHGPTYRIKYEMHVFLPT